MYGLLAFWFSSTDFLGPDKDQATVVAGGLEIVNNLCVVKLDKLDELRIALKEILEQAADGVIDGSKIVVGGLSSGSDLVVTYTLATDLIKVGSLPSWSRTKATKFHEALVAFSLVVLPVV